MKFGLKLKNIQLGEIKVGEVEVNTDFSINEMVAIRKESEYLLANLPMYIEQLGDAFVTGLTIDKSIREFEEIIDTEEEAEEDCEPKELTQEEIMEMAKAIATKKAIERFFRK